MIQTNKTKGSLEPVSFTCISMLLNSWLLDENKYTPRQKIQQNITKNIH